MDDPRLSNSFSGGYIRLLLINIVHYHYNKCRLQFFSYMSNPIGNKHIRGKGEETFAEIVVINLLKLSKWPVLLLTFLSCFSKPEIHFASL